MEHGQLREGPPAVSYGAIETSGPTKQSAVHSALLPREHFLFYTNWDAANLEQFATPPVGGQGAAVKKLPEA